MVARAQPLSPHHKMLLQTSISPPPLQLPFGSLRLRSHRLSIQAVVQCCSEPIHTISRMGNPLKIIGIPKLQIFQGKMEKDSLTSTDFKKWSKSLMIVEDKVAMKKPLVWLSALTLGQTSCLVSAQASEEIKLNAVFETGELFELGIQLSYLLLLLALLGAGSFFVIRQVLVRRELDLSAKELQEQVRSGDASATELFELGAVMLRRKFYPAATKYLLQAIDKWDGDDQDLAQVYNALGVSYVRDEKVDKGIAQFEKAVKIQPGYVTAWNNLGDALEKKKDYTGALKAFEEVLLFDPNNKIGRPRRDALKDQVEMYKGVSVKSKDPVKSKQK